MKKHECEYCSHFTPAQFELQSDWTSNIVAMAKCNLGKRVMYRIPTVNDGWQGGYYRYCDEFEQIDYV